MHACIRTELGAWKDIAAKELSLAFGDRLKV